MSGEEKIRALQDALDLKQKELDLLMAIDAIRDNVAEPAAMLAAIVKLLADRLEADVCWLFLLDRESRQVELKAVHDRSQLWGQPEQVITRELAERAVHLPELTIWKAQDVLPETAMAKVPPTLQLMPTPIIMGTHERLGAILLARAQPPFSPPEAQLLKTAEEQVDSAVIQGYVKCKLDLRQQELDLLMAIDAIRDNVPEPAAMLAAIVKLLADRLEADVCLLFLLDRESGQVELKAVHDRGQQWGQLEQAITRELAERAVHLPELTIWKAQDVLPEAALAKSPPTLQLMATPIIMGTDERLGAILLTRAQLPFGPPEAQLLKTAEEQVDSAVTQGYVHDRLKQHAKELETIFRIDHIRDQGLALDEMLNAVIQELSATIEAEIGFIMLYDRAGRKLEMRASTHGDLLATMPYYDAVNQTVNESLERAELICRNDLGQALRSVMCLPLILNEQVIGVLGMANRYGPRGFTAADRRLLTAIGSQVDTAIYERREIRVLRQILGRSIDPRVMDRLLTSPDVDFLKGELLELTVLFADIRGSTHLAENTEPAVLVEFIKDFLSHMTEVILKHEGTIDKFVGDEVMALFGAPVPQEDHALRAVRVGLDMQMEYQTVMKRWQERGLVVPPIGIGIATGEMTAGEMGSPQRTNYTVIGRAVNLGSRICGLAKGDQVLISQRTYNLIRGTVEVIPLPGHHFKGVADDVTVYHVTRVLNP